MTERVLIGKNTNSNLGFSAESPGYGVWVSEDSVSVLSATSSQHIFRTDITDGTSGVTSRNGEVIGAVYRGYTAVTTNSSGDVPTFLIKAWPESDFTVGGTISAPLCLVQIGKNSGASSVQYSTSYHKSTTSGHVNGGMFHFVTPTNRASDGTYDANGTYGAVRGYIDSNAANTTFRVYYAICYPTI